MLCNEIWLLQTEAPFAIAFLSLSSLPSLIFLFFFSLRCTFSLLCLGIFIFGRLSPSKRLLPLNSYLCYNVIIMEAKSSLIEYSLPHRNDYCLIITFFNLICKFISMTGHIQKHCDSKELNQTREVRLEGPESSHILTRLIIVIYILERGR